MTFRYLMMRKLKVPTRQNCVRVHGWAALSLTAAANYTLLLCLIYVWLLLFNKFYFCTFFFFYFSSRITHKKNYRKLSPHCTATTNGHYTYFSVDEHTIIGQWLRLFGLFLWFCFSILEIWGIFMQYIHTHRKYTHPHSRSPTEWRRRDDGDDDGPRRHYIHYFFRHWAQFLQFTLTYFGTNHHILEFKIHGEKKHCAVTFPLIILLVSHLLVWCFCTPHTLSLTGCSRTTRLAGCCSLLLTFPSCAIGLVCGKRCFSPPAHACTIKYDLTFSFTPRTFKVVTDDIVTFLVN